MNVRQIVRQTPEHRLLAEHPDHPSVLQLTGVYHNLLRRWGEL